MVKIACVFLCVVSACMLLQSRTYAADQQGFHPNRYIGFRNDGSGVFRDCTPITSWSEFDYEVKENPFKAKSFKKAKPIRVAIKENMRNIVYKVPHVNWCNGGMLIVKGRLYALADRGGLGFLTEQEPDYMGVKLFCIDPETGKELWSKDLHHNDQLPDPTQADIDVQRFVKEYYQLYSAYYPWIMHARSMVKGHEAADEDRYQVLAGRFRKYMAATPKTLDEFRSSQYAKGYEQLTFNGIVNKSPDKVLQEFAELRRKVQSGYGYNSSPWMGKNSFVGVAMQTPVSDGKHIYVSTGHGDVFCLTLDGEMVWKKFYKWTLNGVANVSSPILAKGKLIVKSMEKKKGGAWVALDCTTGEIVWQKLGLGAYGPTAPTHLSLSLDGPDGDVLDVLYTAGGSVIRLDDGKLLAKGLGRVANCRPAGLYGNIIVINNGTTEGGGKPKTSWPVGGLAFRLVAKDRDSVEAEQLWHTQALDRIVACDGVVYGFQGTKKKELVALDVLTGKKIASASWPSSKVPHHLISVVGEYVFAHDGVSGRTVVYATGADRQTLKKVDDNWLGDADYHGHNCAALRQKFFNEGGQPFFSGNRVWIRSYRYLYCLGDVDEAMRLSVEHQ